MQAIRQRLTYANVMSTIAVFLLLGGATAVAASKLGRNSVGTRQLKPNAVTAAKLKRNAVTTAKIRNGAVTGAKVKTSTLGTVPSASTLDGYSRKGIVRVAATPFAGTHEATQAASPEVPLFSSGPFTVYAKCFDDGEGTAGVVLLRTAEDGAIFHSDRDAIDGGAGSTFLNADTPEDQRELEDESSSADEANFFARGEPFTAMAPDGTVIRGDLAIAVKHGSTPEGGGRLYGPGDGCLFAGQMTTLNR